MKLRIIKKTLRDREYIFRYDCHIQRSRTFSMFYVSVIKSDFMSNKYNRDHILFYKGIYLDPLLRKDNLLLTQRNIKEMIKFLHRASIKNINNEYVIQ